MTELTEETKLPFDEKFQLTLLELMLTDKKVAEKAYINLKPDLFPNEYFAKIFSMLQNLHEKFPHPSSNQLKNEIAKITDVKSSEIYIKIFGRITVPQDFRDYQYCRENLNNYLKQRLIFKLANGIIKNQQTAVDKLEEMIIRDMALVASVNNDTIKTKGLDNLLGFLIQSAEDSKKLIPTYLPSIDKALGGGCPIGTLALGIGGTNVGKSIWLINWTYKLIMSGYKVFYVNLEGYEAQVLQRLICRAIRAPIYNVKNNILTDWQKEKLLEFENKCKDNFKFFHNDSFDMSIESFVPALRNILKNEFKANAVVYDYGQLFKSKKNHDGLRHEQAYCHRVITTLAGEEGIQHLAITVAQGQRDTNVKNNSGSSLTRMTDISECFEINRAAATVFTLNRSEKDEEMERIKILMDKNRDGKKNVVEFCKTDFGTVTMFGDETEGLGFMNMRDYLTENGEKAV